MTKAVIFDLDDTLYAERDFVFSGFEAVGKAVGGSTGTIVYERLRKRFEEGERGDLFTPVLQELSIYRGEDEVKTLVEVYRSHEPNIAPYDDVRDALASAGRRYSLGLLSDGIPAVQLRKLKALGLEHCFDLVVITGQWGREFWKPHRKGYDHCVSTLKIGHEQTCYVGDNPEKDFITARTLGWKTLRVRRKGGLHCDQERGREYEADYEVPDLRGVLERLSLYDSPASPRASTVPANQ